MKSRSKTVWTHHCDVCKTGYNKKADARKCDKLPVEPPVAKVGDCVRIREKRECLVTGKCYIAEGLIKQILGPLPPDVEYEMKWLGGTRLSTHVLSYIVKFKCPHCKDVREHSVYAPEFMVLKGFSVSE